jgi:hypothetical protein
MDDIIRFKRTSLQDKRPTASGLALGEPAVILHEDSFGVFLKDALGAIRKIGPIHIGPTPPNASPIGSSGNGVGEAWIDTANSNILKVWDGAGWIEVTGGTGSSFDPYIIDFGLDVGSVDYGLIANSATSTEDWGVLSYLTN